MIPLKIFFEFSCSFTVMLPFKDSFEFIIFWADSIEVLSISLPVKFQS